MFLRLALKVTIVAFIKPSGLSWYVHGRCLNTEYQKFSKVEQSVLDKYMLF